MSQGLASRLSVMLGGDAGVGCEPITGNDGLWPEEAAGVIRAIPARQAEFAAGRRAARVALGAIGEPPVALPPGPARAPLWPPGVVGSISHDAGLAIAAVMRRAQVRGLGIDLTEAAPLPGETRHSILPHAAEQELDAMQARAGFSAKECLFKALFPETETFFGFEAATVLPDIAEGRFDIRLTRTLGPFAAGTAWTGGVAVLEDLLLTTLVVA